jgi:hypothetical protein
LYGRNLFKVPEYTVSFIHFEIHFFNILWFSKREKNNLNTKINCVLLIY